MTQGAASADPAVVASALLEKVVREVLSDRATTDSDKEQHALLLLSHESDAVRRAVLERLPARLESLRPGAEFARLKNVRDAMLYREPHLAPSLTAAAMLQEELSSLDRLRDLNPEHAVSSVLRRFANAPGEVVSALLEQLPGKINGLGDDFKARALWEAGERLREAEAALARAEAATGEPEAVAARLLEAYLTHLETLGGGGYQGAANSRSRRNAALFERPGEVRRALIRLLLAHMDEVKGLNGYTFEYTLKDALGALLEREPALPDDEVDRVFAWAGRYHSMQVGHQAFFPQLVRLAEERLERGPLPTPLLAMLRRTQIVDSRWRASSLKGFVSGQAGPPVNPGEAWTDRVLADLDAMPEANRAAWNGLLEHAATATAAKPNAAWEKKARGLLGRVGERDFARRAVAWLALVGKARTELLEAPPFASADPNLTFDEFNANVLRGLAWCLALAEPDAEAARALAALAETSLKKVAGLGPRSPKLANAAVYVLGRMGSGDAVGQLARLKSRVTFKTTLKEVERALDAAAGRAGLSREDLEELGVPSYGLDAEGVRVEEFGGVRAELRLENGRVTLGWTSDGGKALKGPPAAVKREHAEAVAELKSATKDIEAMVGAQRDRIERLVLLEKSWPLERWRERYLEHPLVGDLARRLIWDIGGTAAIPHEGALVGADGEPFEPAPDAEVSLWHPVGRDASEIVAWRGWLERHGVTQPFKQAHRELYLLTDAERATRVYSNRFAAHIVRQHQFNQLCALRGWRNKLRLMVDDSYPPATLELPLWNLRAEFWVEGAGDDHGVDTNEAGTYLRLATDQVRFYRLDAPQNHAHAGGGGYSAGYDWQTRTPRHGEPVPLEDVPPLVFSEVMRDVDLFVGVGSVGNDPTWADGGPEGRYRDYWQGYAFGDLSETAKTRREALERLVPRLKIASRCSFVERFLVVRGDVRTYKIHLGSGNILMEPGGQYLCIVPGRGAAAEAPGSAFLPFEGDGVLSIILSKAFMLADDTRISDPTITRQISLR